MKFESNPRRHEQIGVGGYKRAYLVPGPNGPEVQLVMKHSYSPEQMKGLFYLNKIATALFPGKIARVHQAGVAKEADTVSAQIRSEYHEHDAGHADLQAYTVRLDGYGGDIDEEADLETKNIIAALDNTLDDVRATVEKNHEVQEFFDDYCEAGFLNENAAVSIFLGPQDIIFKPDGSFVCVDVDVAWDEPEEVGEKSYTIKCLRFDPVKLQTAITNLNEPIRSEVQKYYNRLCELCRQVGFVL